MTAMRDLSGLGMGLAFNGHLRPRAEVCGANKVAFEVTALARVLRVVTEDVTFVKGEGPWQVMALRFHSLAFEAPYVGVVAAAKHDVPDVDG